MLFQWMRIRLHFTQRFIQQLLVPDLIIEPTFYKFLQKEVSGPLNQSSLSLRCTTAQGHISRIHRPLYRQPDPINRQRPRQQLCQQRVNAVHAATRMNELEIKHWRAFIRRLLLQIRHYGEKIQIASPWLRLEGRFCHRSIFWQQNLQTVSTDNNVICYMLNDLFKQIWPW